MVQAIDVRKELQSMADPEKARVLQRFFKTGPGQYGEGSRTMLRYAIERFPESKKRRYMKS